MRFYNLFDWHRHQKRKPPTLNRVRRRAHRGFEQLEERTLLSSVVDGEFDTDPPPFVPPLDDTPPQGELIIENGAEYTQGPNVSIALTATDDLAGIADVRFAVDSLRFGAWQEFSRRGHTDTMARRVMLRDSQGPHFVLAQVRDASGNVSVGIRDTILLDNTAPTGEVEIDGGAEFTRSKRVDIGISGSDNLSGPAEVRYRVDQRKGVSHGPWIPFEPDSASGTQTISVKLPGRPSNHAIYVQLRDHAGNVSRELTDSIVLERSSPGDNVAINDTKIDERTRSHSGKTPAIAIDRIGGHEPPRHRAGHSTENGQLPPSRPTAPKEPLVVQTVERVAIDTRLALSGRPVCRKLDFLTIQRVLCEPLVGVP